MVGIPYLRNNTITQPSTTLNISDNIMTKYVYTRRQKSVAIQIYLTTSKNNFMVKLKLNAVRFELC